MHKGNKTEWLLLTRLTSCFAAVVMASNVFFHEFRTAVTPVRGAISHRRKIAGDHFDLHGRTSAGDPLQQGGIRCFQRLLGSKRIFSATSLTLQLRSGGDERL